MIQIDPQASVSRLADIEDSARGSRIVVGARSVIDSFVKVKPAGGTGDLTIGAAKDPVVSRREPPARPSHQNCIPPPRAAATDAATGWA